MQEERPTSIASLIFLVFLMAGGTAVAFTALWGPLAWCVGMVIGFVFGILAAAEYQLDKERGSRG